MRTFRCKCYRLAVAHEFAEPDVVQRHTGASVEYDILQKRNANRRLSGRDALAGGRERRYQKRLLGSQVMDEFVSLLLAHDLVQTGKPLRGRGVLTGIRDHDLAFVLRLYQIFQ